MTQRSRYSGLAILVFLLVLPAYSGCDPSMESAVEGDVTWREVPLRGVTVTFVPENGEGPGKPRSFGVTDENGHYVLVSADGKKGCSTGPHRVLIVDSTVEPTRAMKGERTGQQLPPPVKGVKQGVHPELNGQPHAKFDTTPLRRDVVAGKQTVDFHLP